MSLEEDLKATDVLDPVEVGGIYNLTLFNKSSGPRLHLTGSYFEQSLILNESEVPRMYTGFEKELGSYNDSLKIAKCNYKILHRIEKFPTNPGFHYTLILQDVATGVIGSIENRHYESLAEDHGYFKPMTDTDFKSPGSVIEKGSVLSKANSHDDHFNYKYGVNANVAYISKKDDIEDGIIISEDFANRVSYASVKTIELTLGFNDILLNIYGDENIYKSFPDIFGDVKDGIFCAKRSIDSLNSGCNTTAKSLMMIDTNDELYHGDGKILDVEIFINSNAELMKDNAHRQQIIAYYNIVREYKYKICKHLETYVKNKAYNVTEEAITRYHNYKNYVDSCNSPTNDIRFSNSTGTFEFAYIKFTIGRSVNLSEGTKLTNRFGGKGVVCKVVPTHLMPVDAFGTVADVILNPCGVIGRSNPGQCYEQELNFIADRVADKIKESDTIVKKYSLLHKFFSMIDNDNAIELERYYKTLSNHDKHQFFDRMVSQGIHIRQHPFNNITFEQLKKVYIEFGVKPSYIKTGIRVHTENGSEIRYYKSLSPVIIGKEYIMILKHTTDSKFSSVSVSDVNSLGLPHKNTSKSKNLPFRSTPIKFGEMEINISLNRCSPLIVNRLLAGNGSNLKHRDRVSKMLLEEDPFVYHNVDVASEDITDSIASDAFVAIMRQLGYCIYGGSVERSCEIGLMPKHIRENGVMH